MGRIMTAEGAWRWLGAVALSFGLAMAPIPGGAQQAAPMAAPTAPGPSILTINQDKLFKDSLYGERVTRERDTQSRALAAENRRIEADLGAEEKALTEQRKTLPAAEFRKLADAFDKKVQGMRRAQDDKARALTRLQEQEQKLFFSKVLPILAQLLRERHAAAILDRRAILVASDSIDVTDEALRLIDATLGDGKGTQP